MKFKKIDNFRDHYMLGRDLGSGAFGTVKIGQHRRSNMTCAVKIIKKQKLREHHIYEQLNKNEFEVLEETQHPHITRIFELLEDNRNYYIVAELMAGGHLMDKIMKQKNNNFSEQSAANIVH